VKKYLGLLLILGTFSNLLDQVFLWEHPKASPVYQADPCSFRTKEEPKRARILWKQLRSLPSSFDKQKALFEHIHQKKPRICFGQNVPSVVTLSGTIYIDKRRKQKEESARLAHLLMHLANPITFKKGKACKAQVQSALRAEAKAMSLELHIRKALKMGPPMRSFGFESVFWQTKRIQREKVVLAHLNRYPKGAPGIPPLREGYTKRCANLQKRKSTPGRQAQ